MAFIRENPNPKGAYVGDCVIRAISIATEHSWERVYVELAMQGFVMCDMPSSNHVWGSFLRGKGFARYPIPYSAPDGYTISEFCDSHPEGVYILATGSHVVAVADGDYYDTWDSGDEIPVDYWQRSEEHGDTV